MNFRILIVAIIAIILVACNQQQKTEPEHDDHEHEEPKFQYTAYSADFELFAEADAFVVGETANVLSHFSILPDFKAVENGSIRIILTVNGKGTGQILEKPTRKGIFSFDIKPETAGKGTLKFEITNEKGRFEVLVPEVVVFAGHDEAHKAGEAAAISKTNTAVFTKEQSWKIDFSTGFPITQPFGEVIKTTALVQPAPGDEIIVSAGTSGTITISGNALLEGNELKKGQLLCKISGNNMADNNFSVRYKEAESNFEKAKADYERAQKLASDKIVSDKDLNAAKNQYENSKAIFENLSANFSTSGQTVVSPLSGFVKQVFVKNGTFVEAGQPVAILSQNRTLLLIADVPVKFAAVLGNIQSANLRTPNDNRTYTFDELNGKVLAYGKSATAGSYLVPVTLQIDNIGNFIPGSFAEVYLKTLSGTEALTVPIAALLEEQGSFFVWVQVNPELFEKREVAVGKSDGILMEIVRGLRSDERIVTRGAMLIKLAQATGTLDAHSGHVH